MVKILSRSGDSLADTYDVQGSIAGIEQLRSDEVTLVHEMGSTFFSERFSTFLRVALSGTLNQGNGFGTFLTDLPSVPSRVLGVVVFADTAARIDNVSLAVRSEFSDREMPIWVWDQTTEVDVRIDALGSGVVTRSMFIPLPLQTLPTFAGGGGQPQIVEDLVFRGEAAAFGAGTVAVTALIYLAFSQIGGLSSRGLTVPSW